MEEPYVSRVIPKKENHRVILMADRCDRSGRRTASRSFL